MKQRETSPTVDDLRFELARVLTTAITDLGSAIGINALLEQAMIVVDSLPMSTTEYSIVSNRLGNALHYANLGEPGAAKYELQLALRSSLSSGNPLQVRQSAYDSP